MAVKRRKLSPSASSRSSATPGPSSTPASTAAGAAAVPGLASLDGVTHTIPQPASPSTVSASLDVDAASFSQHPRSSVGATPGPAGGPAWQDRAAVRHGVVQQGSGDGTDCGDECYIWNDLPMNKHGFRYAACAPSPITSPLISYPFYRIVAPAPPCPPVHLSWVDRSPFLRLSADASTCTTDRGFRAGRANMSVREGRWYFECHILRGHGGTGGGGGTGGDVGNAHVRVGWGRREAQIDAPVGADGYAYGIRDVDGAKVHISRMKPYAERGFGTGDVVGCLITLPKRRQTEEGDNGSELLSRKRTPIRYKGQLYFELDDIPPAKEMEALVDREGKVAAAKRAAAAEAETPSLPKGKKTKNAKAVKNTAPAIVEPTMRDLPILPGSRIDFFLNGEPAASDGEAAFTDLYDFLPLPPVIHPPPKHGRASQAALDKGPADDGSLGYYPMISCFGRGKAKLVCGPDFAFPPPGLVLSPSPSDGIKAEDDQPSEAAAASNDPDRIRPMCERTAEYLAQEAVLDEADELTLSERFRADIEDDRIRRERAEKKIAASAAKKAARTKARVSVSETPTPAVKSGLAYEVKPDPEEDSVPAADGSAQPGHVPDSAYAGHTERELEVLAQVLGDGAGLSATHGVGGRPRDDRGGMGAVGGTKLDPSFLDRLEPQFGAPSAASGSVKASRSQPPTTPASPVPARTPMSDIDMDSETDRFTPVEDTDQAGEVAARRAQGGLSKAESRASFASRDGSRRSSLALSSAAPSDADEDADADGELESEEGDALVKQRGQPADAHDLDADEDAEGSDDEGIQWE